MSKIHRLGVLSVTAVAFVTAVALAIVTLGNGARDRVEPVGLHGHVSIQAYHADGTRFAAVEQDNALTSFARSKIASCGSAVDTTPAADPCTNWVSRIFAYAPSGPSLVGTTTNTVLPLGCNTELPLSGETGTPCDSWQVQRTFDSEIAQTMTVSIVQGHSGLAVPFDVIFLASPISVSPGDRLVITITFTIP